MPVIQPELRSYENSGFQVVFQNGWTISVMFGPGTLSSNRDIDGSLTVAQTRSQWKATSAAVGIWDVDGVDVRLSADIQRGFVSPDKIAKLIAFVQSLNPALRALDFGAGAMRVKLAELLAE